MLAALTEGTVMQVVLDVDVEGMENLEPGSSEHAVYDINEALRDSGLDMFVTITKEG